MTRNYGRSLAFVKFVKTLENQIRAYWQINTSLLYSQRWIDLTSNTYLNSSRLTEYPGDNVRPFNCIDISRKEYLSNIENVIELSRENSFVNFITAFEVYLFDIISRIIYLHPNIIEDSEMPIEAGIIGKEILRGEIREWFSIKVTDKYLRNLTHLKMLLKVQKMIKGDIKKTFKTEIEEWNKWTYVRNAIIHNGRVVSEDLKNVWSTRFNNLGAKVLLNDKDIVVVHSLALKLVKIIDEFAIQNRIQNEDSILLVRELYVQFGIEKTNELARKIFLIHNFKMKTQEIEKTISFQKKTNSLIQGWRFSKYNFEE